MNKLKFLLLPIMVLALTSCDEPRHPIIVDIDKDKETFDAFFSFGETGKISETEIVKTTYGKKAPSAIRIETSTRNSKIRGDLFWIESKNEITVDLDSKDLVGYLNSISTGATEENAIERLNFHCEQQNMIYVLEGGKYHIKNNEASINGYIDYSNKIAPLVASTFYGEYLQGNVFNCPTAKELTLYNYIYDVAFNGPRYFDQTDYSVHYGYADSKRSTDVIYDDDRLTYNYDDTAYIKQFDCFDGKFAGYAERKIEKFLNGGAKENIRICNYDREEIRITWPEITKECNHEHYEEKIELSNFDGVIYNYKSCTNCGHSFDIERNIKIDS